MADVRKSTKASSKSKAETRSPLTLSSTSTTGLVRDKIIGHQKIIQALLESLLHGTFSHAWIFAGPNGVGKRQVAWALAQTLICERRLENSSRPCGECGPCRRVFTGNSESVLALGPTNNQIRIDESKRVFEFLHLQKIGRARVVIIDQAELLNPQAANALLKTLEEPPADTYFFLIAGSIQDVLLTIRSRSQLVRFKGLTRDELQEAMPDVPGWVAASSQGRIELALQLLEKSDLRISAYELLKSLGEDSLWQFAQRVKVAAPDRETSLEILRLWQQLLRDFLFSKIESDGVIHQDLLKESARFWNKFGIDRIQRLFELSIQAEHDIRANVDRGLALERVWIHNRNLQ